MKNNGIDKKELMSLFEKFSTRVDMLPQQQRAFVRLFISGQSYANTAKTAGVNEATIARKLRKIAARISSDNFIAALSQNSSISPEKMKILKDYFIGDQPITRIAKNRNVSIYIVRKTVRTLNIEY